MREITPSIEIDGHNFAVGDTLRYRLSPGDRWRVGSVCELRPADSALRVTPERGLDRRPLWLLPAQVAPLHGAELVEAREHAAPARPWGLPRRAPLQRKAPLRPQRLTADPGAPCGAAALPTLRIVRTVGALHAVPKAAPPARSPEYLSYVRQQPCAACAAPGPSEAHHEGPRGVGQRCSDYLCVPLCHRCHQVRTDSGALPGLDPDRAQQLLRATQVQLLVRWVEDTAAAAAAHLVQVPVLRLVAGGSR